MDSHIAGAFRHCGSPEPTTAIGAHSENLATGFVQKDPNRLPNTITMASANSAPTMQAMTMSR